MTNGPAANHKALKTPAQNMGRISPSPRSTSHSQQGDRQEPRTGRPIRNHTRSLVHTEPETQEPSTGLTRASAQNIGGILLSPRSHLTANRITSPIQEQGNRSETKPDHRHIWDWNHRSQSQDQPDHWHRTFGEFRQVHNPYLTHSRQGNREHRSLDKPQTCRSQN